VHTHTITAFAACNGNPLVLLAGAKGLLAGVMLHRLRMFMGGSSSPLLLLVYLLCQLMVTFKL